MDQIVIVLVVDFFGGVFRFLTGRTLTVMFRVGSRVPIYEDEVVVMVTSDFYPG